MVRRHMLSAHPIALLIVEHKDGPRCLQLTTVARSGTDGACACASLPFGHANRLRTKAQFKPFALGDLDQGRGTGCAMKARPCSGHSLSHFLDIRVPGTASCFMARWLPDVGEAGAACSPMLLPRPYLGPRELDTTPQFVSEHPRVCRAEQCRHAIGH